MRIKVVEKYEGVRVYFVDADDVEDAQDIVYSGGIEPDHEEEDGNEMRFYDENGNSLLGETEE